MHDGRVLGYRLFGRVHIDDIEIFDVISRKLNVFIDFIVWGEMHIHFTILCPIAADRFQSDRLLFRVHCVQSPFISNATL